MWGFCSIQAFCLTCIGKLAQPSLEPVTSNTNLNYRFKSHTKTLSTVVRDNSNFNYRKVWKPLEESLQPKSLSLRWKKQNLFSSTFCIIMNLRLVVKFVFVRCYSRNKFYAPYTNIHQNTELMIGITLSSFLYYHAYSLEKEKAPK